MAINPQGDGLTYLYTEGDVNVFGVYLSGHLVIIVAVDVSDPHYHIVVRRPDLAGSGHSIMTTGRGYASQKYPGRVSSTSLEKFIYPNLLHLLAALYVPDFAERVTQVNPLAKTKPANPEDATLN